MTRGLARVFADYEGRRIGCWVVLSLGAPTIKGEMQWICLCDCGNIKQVRSSLILSSVPSGCKSCVYRIRGAGGRHLNDEGYVRLSGYWFHPNSNKRGQILEHILIMSQIKRRPLVKGETVHHKNGIRHDNRPDNLQLWYSQPSGQHVEDLIAYLESTGHKIERPQ